MKCVILTDSSPSQPRTMVVSPDSAVIYRSNPWFVPEDTDATWQASFWVAAVIDRLGKNINARFARRYYNNVCIVAHPANISPSAEGDPLQWMRDGAVVKGPDIPLAQLPDSIIPALQMAGAERQDLAPLDKPVLLDALDNAVVTVSATATIKTGDLLLIPFQPVMPLQVAERTDFQVYLCQTPALKFKTR